MPKIAITEFFETLDAPLKNHVWSWGAVTQSSNDVVLRVWDDEKIRTDGKTYHRLTLNSLFHKDQGQTSLGYPERLEHLEIARQNGRAFLVFCRVANQNQHPRTIAGYTDHVVGVCEKFVTDNEGDIWGEITRIIKVEDYLTMLRSH